MSEQNTLNENASEVLLTPEGFIGLHEELEMLTMVKRPEIADRIRESQQHGEFSEDNSELDEVKFEQAMVENRIAELKGIFANARKLEFDQIPDDHVGIGSYVTLDDPAFGEQFEVRLVSSVEADPAQDLVSVESPMGSAVYGASPDSWIEFLAPEGKKRFKVVSIRVK